MNVDPTRAQFEAFKALPRDQPVNMLNLVKLRADAAYAEGKAPRAGMTGADAYRAYGEGSAPVFTGVGGSILWRGAPQTVLIGPEGEGWDIAFIARYPTLGAFLAMVTDPAYREVVHHRQAAVEDSRLIAMADLSGGSVFG